VVKAFILPTDKVDFRFEYAQIYKLMEDETTDLFRNIPKSVVNTKVA